MNDEEIVFITEDKGIRKTGEVDPTDMEIIKSAKTGEGIIQIKSKEQLMALAKAASDTFDYFREQARKMTKEQAEFIRRLRVDEGYSWRAVARRCYGNHRFRDWPKWGPPSNQIMGMALCERAAEFFGEDYRKEPWN